jgi:hypothetical protein
MEYDRVIPLLNYIKENINDDKEWFNERFKR